MHLITTFNITAHNITQITLIYYYTILNIKYSHFIIYHLLCHLSMIHCISDVISSSGCSGFKFDSIPFAFLSFCVYTNRFANINIIINILYDAFCLIFFSSMLHSSFVSSYMATFMHIFISISSFILATSTSFITSPLAFFIIMRLFKSSHNS
ncbi:hypothetical protein CWI42_051270 [Ordospora colligata]|uniref:Uncharacterized protein n=1 Tax=Ordospora colligata OC4 TaxID=1354746 RepID=A0A0B2UK67_9MICR|nr:uncharacterized protein M896_051320 [Ordospora colligata OC4]KHN69723.1 hypothetical protein M896_051320 [Ordospora colligata OC4]TBU15526.1 hypothetical protein CWI41_051310 [Ordospora colligata]TBU15689.1 hypothetical protein CWI40_051300 [Ordospora colligata]TBU18644.1 hypothetical protein CWI42_051270 [Ordospora colligata]